MLTKPKRSARRDRRFFEALENGHAVRAACAAARYGRSSVYEWREADAAFAAAWARAVQIAADLLEDEADRRGRDGTDEPVFFRGAQVGAKRKYSDALLLARLKALKPDLYRERIPSMNASGQKITIVVRDFVAEAQFARLVAERVLTLKDVPTDCRDGVVGLLANKSWPDLIDATADTVPDTMADTVPDTTPDTMPNRRPLSDLSGFEGRLSHVKG